MMLSSMLPQTRAVLSGTGGVFDSPAAQEYWNRRFGSGQLSAARAAARKFIDLESAKIAEPFSRQPKVQDIETKNSSAAIFCHLTKHTLYSNIYRKFRTKISILVE